LPPEELERYCKYVKSEHTNINLKGMSKAQMARIKSKLKQKWFTNIMLKRKVNQINDEIAEDYK
jgi:hypothetical protein